MSDLKAKMYQRSPDPLAGLLLRGGRGREEREKEGPRLALVRASEWLIRP